MSLRCKNCGAKLTEAPEPERHEWFIRCLECGVRNVITPFLQIVGWTD